ncbi:d-alanyl-D-alanine carboxypeptidase DacA1 [Clostridium sp. CAG:448]|nr:d-alanyl-D-alanine carboxypeptidase DacA1 [Clostridium sp. CAG:448]
MKKETVKQYIISPVWQILAIALILLLSLSTVGIFMCRTAPAPADKPAGASGSESGASAPDGSHPFAAAPYRQAAPTRAEFAKDAAVIPQDSIKSGYAALVNVGTNEVIASRRSKERIYPASITKVMTMIVVVENLESVDSLQDKITISQKTYDDMVAAKSSGIGMAAGEILNVESLLYLMMLQSDGIATTELAIYTAGTTEKFVDMMNEKAKEMGLEDTHFTNCTGLHNDNHYSTCRDLASIMCYAVNNTFCYTLMTTKEYKAPAYSTEKNKNFFYYPSHTLLVDRAKLVLKSQPSNLTVTGGKTGFTDESRHCLATCGVAADGTRYVSVTAQAQTQVDTITDYITIYETYAK